MPLVCPSRYACATAGSMAPTAACPTSFFPLPQGATTCSPPAVYVNTLAGSTVSGYADGIGCSAKFVVPYQVSTDSVGNLYVIDRHSLRRVTDLGVVTTIAGGGTAGYLDGQGTTARFNIQWSSVVVSPDGSVVYVSDSLNYRVRRVDVVTGLVVTLAGSGVAGYADGLSKAAQFQYPGSLALDVAGNVYVADMNGHRVRKITVTGMVSTVAGSGAAGYVDRVHGTQAAFNTPIGIAVDRSGTLWLADVLNHRVRSINLQTGFVNTVAGDGSAGFSDGVGSIARFFQPRGIALGTGNSAGMILIGDHVNYRVRQLNVASGVITTLTGSGQNVFADGSGTVIGYVVGCGDVDSYSFHVMRVRRSLISVGLCLLCWLLSQLSSVGRRGSVPLGQRCICLVVGWQRGSNLVVHPQNHFVGSLPSRPVQCQRHDMCAVQCGSVLPVQFSTGAHVMSGQDVVCGRRCTSIYLCPGVLLRRRCICCHCVPGRVLLSTGFICCIELHPGYLQQCHW
jgi:sugar lactone lactonase YvrE